MKGKIFMIISLCIFLTGLLYGCVEEENEENEAPTCALAANPTSGTAPLTVTFTLTASDNDGSISSWKLDIDNDGNADYSGTGNPPTSRVHTYDSQGSYTAKLTVTDNEEKTGTDTITITVNEPSTENQSPTCTLSVNPNSGYVPLTVTFSMGANDPDGTIASWSLDINNDGTPEYSSTGSPSNTKQHTYTSTGTFTAKLKVIDNQGASDTDTATISVTEEPSGNQPPTCSLTVNPSSGYAPLSVTFSMSANDPDGSISSWALDINNDGLHDYTGSGNPASSLQHTYTNTGTYTAKLTVTDDQGATASYTRTITVGKEPSENQVPICTLSANPTNGTAPLTVTFTMTASDSDGSITTWSLDINNDGTSDYAGSGTPPSTKQHIYQTLGAYTANLTVTDNQGASSSDTIIITVSQSPQNQPPTCSLSANPISGNAPLSVIFTLSGTDPDGTISSWALDVNNDGTPEYSGAGTPPGTQQHSYQEPGTYIAKLTVTDNDGADDTNTITINSFEGGDSYKAACRDDITYAQLNSNPNSYKGERITYKGQIIQVIGGYGEIRYRIDVGSSDIIYVTMDDGISYDEDDFVEIWGEVKGTYTYTSTAGWTITIPHIETKYIEKVSFKLNMGETAKWKGIEVTVKSAVKTSSYTWSGGEYTEYADNGRTFIILDVNVKMVGDSSEYIYGGDFWLVDSNGYKYDCDSGTYLIDGGLEGTDIYQNQQVDGKILFDMPISASGLKAQYNLESSYDPLLVEWTLNL